MKYHPLGILLLTLAWPWATSNAALTDIANAPMASASSAVVKPNLMFILDDSGSMSFTFMPDEARHFLNRYGYTSNHCNAAYYNPSITYVPPFDAENGVSYANANFYSALTNGFDPNSDKVDLSDKFSPNRFVPDSANNTYSSYGTSKYGNDAAYYYLYYGTQTNKNYANTKSTFYKECNSAIGDKPGKNVFTKITVSATSGPGGTDERTNFANWYSYYRTRMQMMKTAVGRAFKNIDDRYRVGFTTINYTGTANTNSEFLNISDFDQSQKNSWYSKLYAIAPYDGTPLRRALSKAGRIFAGKVGADPVQYSCQQNFAILSTDGYWNGGDGYQMNGYSHVGDQDGHAERPMYDAWEEEDTLSDVAMYYYQTDLRHPSQENCTGALGEDIDVCENNVPGSGVDVNSKQHMTTFTLGLGVDGTLAYNDDYLSASSGDYYDIAQGTKRWPKPVADTATAVDDLWHAAVNGRGLYFSAKNPDSLVSGLGKALAGVSARTGAASAAATSNLQPVAGDNYAYLALYRTVKWDGDLQAKTFDLNTGQISETALWSAQPLLDAKVSATSDTRTIYTFSSTSNNKLKSFTWSNLTAAEKAYFSNLCSPIAQLSQCPDLSAEQQTEASGENLVNFIRGQTGYESQSENASPLYRDREHVLGDMIGSEPAYLKRPPFLYSDDNYNVFRDTVQKSRAGRVYVAANDGMLHAFNAETGIEEWAYIPPMVMPKLYKLADVNYAANHQYYVDGAPAIGEICSNAPASTCSGAEWKSILVGGLNAGGRGYYALDITNPSAPKALWNFTKDDDEDLGYTYGNPVITKRQDGTWVVVFASGYNNVSPGDGKGYLYVLKANTGELLEKIGTNVGDTTTPSGLAKINGWVDSPTNDMAERFYGGDLLGNVWRFDIDDTTLPAGKEAVRIAELGKVDLPTSQPITTQPILTELKIGGTRHAVITVATGRYLGISDLSDDSQQSIYAFKDNLTPTGLGKLRQPGVLVKQTLTTFEGANNQLSRTTSTNPVNWANTGGWYLDFNPNNESPGERVNVDMQQALGVLTVAANVPNSNACTIGGYAWLYYFDYKTGQYVQTVQDGTAGIRLNNNALAAGIRTILVNGKFGTVVTDTSGKTEVIGAPTSGVSRPVRRVSWRELIN